LDDYLLGLEFQPQALAHLNKLTYRYLAATLSDPSQR
jgi:hypothetical protein